MLLGWQMGTSVQVRRRLHRVAGGPKGRKALAGGGASPFGTSETPGTPASPDKSPDGAKEYPGRYKRFLSPLWGSVFTRGL